LRKVRWTDKKGKNHVALVRDRDSDEVAQQGFGISADPPDVGRLNTAELIRDLHNELLRRELITNEDVQQAQNGVTGAILSVFRSKILKLYRGD
jgi:hypothetical protein